MGSLTGMEPMGFIILSIIPAILPNRNLKLRHQFSGHTTQSNLVIAIVIMYKKNTLDFPYAQSQFPLFSVSRDLNFTPLVVVVVT